MLPLFFDDMLPVEGGNLPFDDDSAQIYKVYNDGGHYIATRFQSSHIKTKRKSRSKTAMDIAFDSFYVAACKAGLKGSELAAYILAGLRREFPNADDLESYVEKHIYLMLRAIRARKKRFRRKADLNNWTHFVTFTFDDSKHDADSFRKKLRKCLSNLHTRRGWLYMGVFEEAPDTRRLHFHGLFYIPDGEMIGRVSEMRDYSTAQHQMQTRHENSFFAEAFGRNDFEELNSMELHRGNTIDYILKYIGKTGEQIVYSRGINTEIAVRIEAHNIIVAMQDFVTKYILFDDVINWERDVKHFSYRQLNIDDCIRRRLTA